MPAATVHVLVANYPHYCVGDDGSVWSDWSGKWELRRPASGDGGRLKVTLCNGGGKRRQVLVHVLVLEAFVGPRPPGYECCHNDGNPANNALANLRWDSHSSNELDKIEHGTSPMPPGSAHRYAKLTEADVLEIRASPEKGVTLARRYGVSTSVISVVRNRKSWRHI